MNQQGQILTGEIQSLAFGGQGILKSNGLVVFVPFTAPGEVITCRVIRHKKKFAEAELLSIDSPCSSRVHPACPYFGTCGGCQLQHLDYNAQLEQKRQWIEDSLKRIGQLQLPPVPPVVPATLQWAYRRHISLNLAPAEKGFTAGYIAVDNTSLLPVNRCPIFAAVEDPVVEQLQECVRRLDSQPDNSGRVILLKSSANRYLFYFHFKQLPANAKTVGEYALRQHSAWQGILFSAPGRTLSLGEAAVQVDIEGLSFNISPRSFVQNHPEQSLKIYKTLCELTTTGQKCLDLYCGIGISSLFLARQGLRVTGVESNPEAIKLARENAKQNGIKSADFILGDVKDVLKKMKRDAPPDVVIVNPPREGLHPEVIEALKESSPPQVIYISCMPPTLARDLRLLLGNKYQVEKCQAFDMFPQTAHVETLVLLKQIS